ncbi:MAG: single-stranded-DNA-specific exonuclease RecJ, partial [Acidobacteria bacterium]
MRWNLREVDPPAVRVLSESISSLDLFRKSPSASAIIAKLLLLRGIDTPDAAATFLSPALDQLHSPLLMTGMKAAVDRIEAAIERKEGILVYGDYDVDGTTAIVI